MENEEKEDVNTGAEESVGTETKKENQTFDDVLSNKEYQAEFDRRVQKAIETAKTKWQEINDAEKTEAEKLAKMNKEQKLEYEAQKERKEKESALARLNAYELKDQAIEIAKEKGVDISLLTYFNFETVKAEELKDKIDEISTAFNRAVEKAVNERLKEDTPTTKTGMEGSQPKPIPTVF